MFGQANFGIGLEASSIQYTTGWKDVFGDPSTTSYITIFALYGLQLKVQLGLGLQYKTDLALDTTVSAGVAYTGAASAGVKYTSNAVWH